MELAPELQFKHFTVRELELPADVLVAIGNVPLDEVNVCADADRHVFYAPHTDPKVVEALLIVDDGDWEQVHRAVHDYLAQQPRARLLVEVAGAGGDQDWWWDGMAAMAWNAGER